jgi:hypothetical protein
MAYNILIEKLPRKKRSRRFAPSSNATCIHLRKSPPLPTHSPSFARKLALSSLHSCLLIDSVRCNPSSRRLRTLPLPTNYSGPPYSIIKATVDTISTIAVTVIIITTTTINTTHPLTPVYEIPAVVTRIYVRSRSWNTCINTLERCLAATVTLMPLALGR